MIPVSAPDLSGNELAYVSDCVTSGWISSGGDYLERFETGWAAYCGRRHGIAVTNGTTALQIAVRALGLGLGDEIIMPSFTIISCALAVVEVGATPVLVDSDPRTWCMDVSALEAAVTPRTRAIMPVHIYGHPVDMDPLLAVAERHGLAVIEDAAEVHGAEYLSGRATGSGVWRRCGSFGALSTFSFYANKIVTAGEGGMVVTDDDALAARLRRLRNLDFVPEQRFLHEELGYNYRMTNLQAAVGLAQLERIDQALAGKRRMAAAYRASLGDIQGLRLPPDEPWARNVYWMFGVVLEPPVSATAVELAARLRRASIETRPFFLGMHEQPALRKRGLFAADRHPVAERLARQGLYLPSAATLSEQDIGVIVDAVHQSLRS